MLFPSATRWLFYLTLALASVLISLVILMPLVDNGNVPERSRFVAVFARDATLRRTAVGCAIGLSVTAWVFFRKPSRSWTAKRKTNARRNDVIGA
jgi:uncharacterized membrane protein YccC